MNTSKSFILLSILTASIVGAFGAGYFLYREFNPTAPDVQSTSKNTSVDNEANQEPWWFGVGTFQKGKYWNANCNLSFIVPKGWYLQQQGFTPGNLQATSDAEQPSCNIKLGDDRQFWSVQAYSSPNPRNLSLVEWESQQMGYDVSYKEKKFDNVDTLFLEREPLDLLEGSYLQSAIIATAGWVHTIQYLDKAGSRPRAQAFATLVASIQDSKGVKPNGEKIIATTRVRISDSMDVYTHGDYRFSLDIPHAWFVRDGRNGSPDVPYSGYVVSFESSEKSLFWSSGMDAVNPSLISTQGIAVQVAQTPYSHLSLSSYLDEQYQKGKYQTKKVTLGKNIQATQVWSDQYYQKYNQEYVVQAGDYVYTIGVRQENTKDDATVNAILKSFMIL